MNFPQFCGVAAEDKPIFKLFQISNKSTGHMIRTVLIIEDLELTLSCNQVRLRNTTSLGEYSNQQLLKGLFKISLFVSTSRCGFTKCSQYFKYQVVRLSQDDSVLEFPNSKNINIMWTHEHRQCFLHPIEHLLSLLIPVGFVDTLNHWFVCQQKRTLKQY